MYGITSLDSSRADACKLLKLNRGHWGIENKLHYVRDVTFNEDRSRVRNRKKSQIMAAMRNTVITLIKLTNHDNISAALGMFSENRESALLLVRHGRTK